MALAIRLQAAGIATTLVEARDAVGGTMAGEVRDGFRFEAAPAAVNDADALGALWTLAGMTEEERPRLVPLDPFTRYAWPDGAVLDVTPDKTALHAAIARFQPGDVAGYEELSRLVAAIRADDQPRLSAAPKSRLRGLLDAGRALQRHQGWRPFDALIARHVSSDKLRHALAYPSLRLGGNPLTTPTLLAVALGRDPFARVWWPLGGGPALSNALRVAFERLGGTVRTGDPVARVVTLGTRATGIETESGWTGLFEAVAAGVDTLHLYRDLLAGTPRGSGMTAWLRRRRHSPAQFVVHLGVEKTWPGIAHRTVLMGARHEGWLTDLFEHGVLPQDLLIELHHPSLTDPSVAPDGMSVFSAVVPVPHLGQLPIDWSRVGPVLEERVVAELGRRLIPDLERRIVTRFHWTPVDAARAWNASYGSANGLALTLGRSGAMRPPNRDPAIENLYLVGSDTHPGAGLSGVLTGAEITAGLMIERMSQGTGRPE